MNDRETDLYWEMVRTIKLLGGKSDILGALGMLDSAMPQSEAIEEAFRLVKCWNDTIDERLENIPENQVYTIQKTFPCKDKK